MRITEAKRKMTTVVLAEKPDQGRKFAAYLADGKQGSNRGGYFRFNSKIFGDTVVTWGLGHLAGLALPQKYDLPVPDKWDLQNLPFLPDVNRLKYEIQSGKSKQFHTVKSQLEAADTIIIATDPGREGENIAYNIFKLCNRKIFDKPIKRLWINSLSKKEVLRGFSNLRDSSETIDFYKEANARQIADYLVGMNYTELFTLKLNGLGLKGVFSLGRVQSPVNTLVVENDMAIKNFKPEPYKIIECHTTEKDPKAVFKNKTEFFKDEEFQATVSQYDLSNAKKGTVTKVETTEKETQPQKLFELGSIQEYANKRWKYSSQKTLKIIQKLYEGNHLSYPRTDCELITENEFSDLKENLDAYRKVLGLEIDLPNLEPNKRFVDGSKVLEHYALIPTTEIPDLSKLSEDEKNIYLAVTKRTILMFAENYKYQNTKVTLDVNGMEFTVSGNVPLKAGWKAADRDIDEDKEKEEKLPKFTENEEVPIEVKFVDKETKEPTRITEGKLVAKNGIMAKYSLGTPATRAGIVETLEKRGYIEVRKTKVFPTPKGYLLWDLTKQQDLLIGKPDNTATWEEALQKISKKKFTREKFLENIYKYLKATVTDLKKKEFHSEFLGSSLAQGKTEAGDYTIEEKPKLFEVTDKKDGSSFAIWKNGRGITMKVVKELLTSGETANEVKGLVSKEGKKYSARLTFDRETKKVAIVRSKDFETTDTETIGKYTVEVKPKLYDVTDTTDGSKFAVWNTNGNITQDILKELLEKGRTDKSVQGFTSKSGKTFAATLVLEGGKVNFEFDDSPSEESLTTVGKYKVATKAKLYEATDSDNAGKILIWNTAGNVKMKHVEELLKKGRTGMIKGFKSKAGKSFEARLVLDENTGKVNYEFK